ncbi:MAG: hypothetical protein L0I76_10065 [Pseudonocardia sp.]|nr:hypothetical protein [Pseudonocardia sp.]
MPRHSTARARSVLRRAVPALAVLALSAGSPAACGGAPPDGTFPVTVTHEYGTRFS